MVKDKVKDMVNAHAHKRLLSSHLAVVLTKPETAWNKLRTKVEDVGLFSRAALPDVAVTITMSDALWKRT